MSIPRARIVSAAVALGMITAGGLASCGGDDSPNPVNLDGGLADGSKADVTMTPTPEAGGDQDTGVDAHVPDSASPPFDAGAIDAADAGAVVDRGPTVIPFTGSPNGIYWDVGTDAALYIADDANDRLVKWTDQGGFVSHWDFPDPGVDGGGAGLGQVVRTLDGKMYVTRFGFGLAGNILTVDSTGDAGFLTGGPDAGLNVKRRRIGLALMPDGTFVDSYFVPGDAGHVGNVATLKLPATEKAIVSGLSKPVGVIFNEGKLYISDQDLGLLFSVAITGGIFTPDAGPPVDAGLDAADADDGSDDAADADAAVVDAGPPVDAGVATIFASIAGADLMCPGPDGSIFVGSTTGTVFQVARNGTVTMPITGLKQTRGCAYDGANTRLFVVEHDPADAGAQNTIRIYPIN